MGEAAANLQEEEQGLSVVEGGAGEAQSSEPENLESYIAKEYKNHKNTEGFRHDILSMVSAKKYKTVLVEIDAFYEAKKKTMPHFELKAKRYFAYIRQLIEAIQEHKTIPHFDDLPVAQQKKIHEQVMNYFDELNNTLKRVEGVIHDLKVQDVRSTIWFLKTFSYCIFVILAVAAFAEAVNYLGNPVVVVMRSLTGIFYE
jgi:hypothetical protein